MVAMPTATAPHNRSTSLIDYWILGLDCCIIGYQVFERGVSRDVTEMHKGGGSHGDVSFKNGKPISVFNNVIFQ